MNIKSTVLLCTVLSLFFIIPTHAAETGFTVYGQVFDTDGTPVNGVNVSLSTTLGSTRPVFTTNATQTNGTPVNGYYYIELANLPGGVPSNGTLMTLTASYNGKSASITVPRNVTDQQRVDLYLSTSSTATPIPTFSTTTSTGGGSVGGTTTSGTTIPTVSGMATPTVLMTEIPPTETTTTPAPVATTKSPGFEVIMVVAVLLTLHTFRRRMG